MGGPERGNPCLDGPAWAVAILLFSFAIALIVRASTASNHMGFEPRWGWPLCLAAVLGGAWGWRGGVVGMPAAVVLLAAGLLGGGVLVVLDRFNLLVEYEVWIRRGMPGPWEG